MGRLQTLRPRLAMARGAVRIAETRSERDKVRGERAWRAWYSTARWKRLRLRVFERDGFTCQRAECGRLVGDTSQLVADHRRAHRGDAALFWDEGNLWTLCKPCHDGWKQARERREGWGEA